MSKQSREALKTAIAMEVRALQIATDRVDEAVSHRLGVNRTDLRCLDLLLFQGPLSAGQLAEAAGLSTGAATTAIDRLEQAGYARRTRDPSDRRRVLVAATDLARESQDELYTPLAEAGLAELERYESSELQMLRDFLHTGRQITTEHAERLRRPDNKRRR